MAQAKFCVSCGEEMAWDADFCPACGARQDLPHEPRKRSMSPAAVVLIVIVAVVLLGGIVLGALVAIVGPNVYRAMSDSEVNRAKTQMANFSTVTQLYLLTNRRLPESLDELLEADPQTGESYIQEVPLDPWGNSYELRILDRTGNKFEIVSFGPDMEEGTEDDIVFPERE